MGIRTVRRAGSFMAMDDAGAMRSSGAREQLIGEPRRRLGRETSVAIETRSERLAFEVLHDEIGTVGVGIDVEHLDYMLAPDAPCGSQSTFAVQPGAVCGATGTFIARNARYCVFVTSVSSMQ